MKHTLIIAIASLFFLQACGIKPKQVIPEKETEFPRQYPQK